MIYSISNKELTVKVSSLGAELFSVVGNNSGYEFVWQGDPKFWKDRSPTLFPICGQLYNGKYTYNGKEYKMGGHGFARKFEFALKAQTDRSLTLTLSVNEATKEIYPFDFELDITYSLDGNKLTVSADIKNNGDEIMPATFGAHPGFNIPMEDGLTFEDYYFEFSEECYPNQLTILENAMFAGTTEALLLEDNKKLRLNRELFAIDGIFMNRIANAITLKSDKSSRCVKLEYDGFPYLGIWQQYGADTPFICVEPWCGLPDYEGRSTDITKKNDMFRLAPKSAKTVAYAMIFED